MTFFTDAQEETLFKMHGKDEDYAETMEFLQNSLEEFLVRKVAPNAYQNDIEELFPLETFNELGKLGFMSMPYSEDYGGMNIPYTYYAAGLESLSKADSGFALAVAIHGTASDGIACFASEQTKKQHLADLISGKKIAAFALSEADSGSDAQAMRTSYHYDAQAKEYILNGTKFWITNALSAEIFFVMARGVKGISAFIVDKNGKGAFEQNKIHDKMGVRSSNTAELVFSDYRIPATALVGKEGEGFRYAMRMLNGGRITIASWSTGIAQAAYEKLLKYAHERKLFGKLLGELDNTKKEISEIAIEIQAARDLSYTAALFKNHKSIMKYAAMAKIKATEVSTYVGQRAIQLSGGYGYIRESRIERHLRDALLGRIGEGANEVLKIMVLPRALYKEFEQKPVVENW